MDTLGEAFPRELARVRETLRHYQAIGPAGAYGAGWIKDLVSQADDAWNTQNIGAMIQLYGELIKVKD